MVKIILRLEGAIVFFASLYFYSLIHGNWIIFLLLLLIPDISMIGYIIDKKVGANTYNIIHNYILAVVVILLGMFFGNNFVVQLGLILAAHVAMDRALGFGLKYQSDFKDTHLQKV